MAIDDNLPIFEQKLICRRCFSGECTAIMRTTIPNNLIFKPKCLLGGDDCRWEKVGGA